MTERESQHPGRAESCLVFLAASAVYLAVGAYLTLGLNKVDWGSVATTARAFDVVYGGDEPSISRMGFAEPPLPALLQMPLVAAVPGLGTRALAGPLASALFAAFACATLCKLMAEGGAARWLRWLLVVAFAANPTWLYAAASGLTAPLVCFLALACALYLTRWAREGILRDLVTCGLAAGAALLAHLEAVSLVIAVALGVCLVIRGERRGGWSEVEGTLITLLLPAAAVVGGWTATCWALMGDPLYSLRGGSPADRLWLAALECGLFAFLMLWCRDGRATGARLQAATMTRPFLAGLAPAVIALAASTLVVGWDGAAPSSSVGYAYLQPAEQDGRSFAAIRRVAADAATSAGGGLVLVDSEMAFAISLASGRPSVFISAADEGRRDELQSALSRATHVLSDVGPPMLGTGERSRATRINGLLGGRRLVTVWTMGQWRLFRLEPNVE